MEKRSFTENSQNKPEIGQEKAGKGRFPALGQTFSIKTVSDLVSFVADYPIESVVDYYGLSRETYSGDASRSNTFCPFHKETKPSMLVGGKGNFAYCFSCSKSWTPIQFVKDMEKCGYIQAAKILASFANLRIPDSVISAIMKDYKLLWKQKNGDPKQILLTKEREVEKLISEFVNKFIKFYQSEKNWKYFYADVDYCWGIFDRLNFKEIDSSLVDEVKDWYFKSYNYIKSRKVAWKYFNKWKLETYLEMIGC